MQLLMFYKKNTVFDVLSKIYSIWCFIQNIQYLMFIQNLQYLVFIQNIKYLMFIQNLQYLMFIQNLQYLVFYQKCAVFDVLSLHVAYDWIVSNKQINV